MTNLMNDTETKGRRLFEPVALALLAAGGMSAAVARSNGESDHPVLSVPPITAQALDAASPPPPAPAESPEAAAPAAEAAAVAAPAEVPAESRQVVLTPAPPAQQAPAENRFAESFDGLAAAPQSLALERPEPVAEVAAQPAPVTAPEATPPVAAAEIVPEKTAPAMQLVAQEPLAAPPAVTAAAEPAQLAMAPAIAATEPAARLDNATPAAEPAEPAAARALAAQPQIEAAAPGPVALAVAPPATEPAEPAAAPALAAQPQIEAAAPGPVALAVAPTATEPKKLAFVSEPVIQQLPVTAAVKSAAETPVQPESKPVLAPVKAGAAPRLAVQNVAKSRSSRDSRIGGTIASNFQLSDGTIDYRIGARVNGGEAKTLPMRITRDDQLSVRLADLLALVKPGMDPALYAYLAASRNAEDYVSFTTLRASGIDIRYDAAQDQLLLGVE